MSSHGGADCLMYEQGIIVQEERGMALFSISEIAESNSDTHTSKTIMKKLGNIQKRDMRTIEVGQTYIARNFLYINSLARKKVK